MDVSNLPFSNNIDDRRFDTVAEPSRIQVMASLLRGLLSPAPPPLNRVETWNGDPNMQPGDTRLPPLGSGPFSGVPSAPPLPFPPPRR